MRILLFQVIIFLGVGCKSRTNICLESDKFDENQYTLVNSVKYENGKSTQEIYQHKQDTSKTLVKLFWSNGNLQTSVFYSKGFKQGPAKLFDVDGNVVVQAMYLRDVQNGLTLYYKNGGVSEYAIYYQGKKIHVDSIKKDMLLHSFNDISSP